MARNHQSKTTDDRPQRKSGIDNPSFQHEDSHHGIERIASPKRGRKARSSLFISLSPLSRLVHSKDRLGASPSKKSRHAGGKGRTHSELRHASSHLRSPQSQEMSVLTTSPQVTARGGNHQASSRHQRRSHYNKKLQKKNSLDANFRRRVEKLKEATSSTELDMKLLDKKMTKVLFNMHGVPVGPNVL